MCCFPREVSPLTLLVICLALLMEFLNTPEKRDRRMVHIPMGMSCTRYA